MRRWEHTPVGSGPWVMQMRCCQSACLSTPAERAAAGSPEVKDMCSGNHEISGDGRSGLA